MNAAVAADAKGRRNMKKYIVELEFVASGRVQIEAASEDAALIKADEMKFTDCQNVSIEDVSCAWIVGTVEEVARIARQRKILAEQRQA